MKDRDRNRFALRDKWLASEQRNRELTRQVEQLQERIEAAERLLRVCASREEASEDLFDAEINTFLAAPMKPVAGEEKLCPHGMK